jgi:hypothetical protein
MINGDWFIDLPLNTFDKADLQMVCGADVMLDILADGRKKILIDVSLYNFDEADIMLFSTLGKNEGGAYYSVPEIEGTKFGATVWLCDVTKYVFGDFPHVIYFKKSKITL